MYGIFLNNQITMLNFELNFFCIIINEVEYEFNLKYLNE